MDDSEWGGIRPRNQVVVHHGPRLALVPGEVRFVERPRRRPTQVGVRLSDGEVVWPRPDAVHATPRTDDPEQCWRCRLDSASA